MRRALIALGATLVLLIASVAPPTTLEAEAPLSDRPLGRRSAAIVPIERPLHGIVLTRLGTDDVRVAGAEKQAQVRNIGRNRWRRVRAER